MRVVLDTNVIVSSLFSPTSPNAEIIRQLRRRRFELVISNEVLAEYAEVLQRPKIRSLHKKNDRELKEFVRRLAQRADRVSPGTVLGLHIDDPDDVMFVECAVAGRADVIVSGDKHLLALGAYGNVRVVTPTAFLSLLEQEPSAD